MCIWPDYFSISWRNPLNNELSGIDIDLAREFARRLNRDVRFVETNFRDFMDRLDDGSCDVAMFGVGVTLARAARVDFATPYLSSPVYGVTTLNNPHIRRWEDIDRNGNVVAVAAGTFMEPLMRDTLRHATMASIAPSHRREAELEAGRADVFMSDFPYTRRLIMQGDRVQIIDPPPGFGETRYAPAVRRGNAAWLAAVNAFVAEARADGTLARIAERHGLTPILIR